MALRIEGDVLHVDVAGLRFVLGNQSRIRRITERDVQRLTCGILPRLAEVGRFHVVQVGSPVQSLLRRVVVECGSRVSWPRTVR